MTSIVYVLGAIFALVGVLGFIPGITSDGHLLGIFEVNTLHNIIHLLSGLLGLYAASQGEALARTWAKVFGVIYALVTVLGWLLPDGNILGLIQVNLADNLLHTVLAVAILYVGFGMKK
ncbi:MAG: DUF4383 domain-containing protein [Patescibacteria group bacterium]